VINIIYATVHNEYNKCFLFRSVPCSRSCYRKRIIRYSEAQDRSGGGGRGDNPVLLYVEKATAWAVPFLLSCWS